MRRTIIGAILICLTLNALAADDSVFGTHWVKFQPIQVAGDIQGCQLTFLTVTADRVYLDGNQVAVNGSIVLRATDRALGLLLKVGLKDITSLSAFERPAFAYLRHKSKKQSFQVVFWATVMLNCGALIWLLTPQGSIALRSILGATA